MQITLTENQLFNAIYEATMKVVKESPLFELTHRPEFMQRQALMYMTENSINRILSHGQYGFAIISAHRGMIEDPNPELNMREQCIAELTIVFKTLLGVKITNEEWEAVQYDGFDSRYEKLMNVFENKPNINDVKSSVWNDENRAQWLKIRNEWADNALMMDLKNADYAWSKVFGGYHGNNDVVDSFEPSYVVYNHSRKGVNHYGEWQNLFDFAVAMCGKYKQESVYTQAPNEAPVWVNMYGQVVSGRSSKKVWINRPFDDNAEGGGTGYTTNKRKKNSPQHFTADIKPMGENKEPIRLENYLVAGGPSTLHGRIRRRWCGEIFLTE